MSRRSKHRVPTEPTEPTETTDVVDVWLRAMPGLRRVWAWSVPTRDGDRQSVAVATDDEGMVARVRVEGSIVEAIAGLGLELVLK